jgi:hypothetical protein
MPNLIRPGSTKVVTQDGEVQISIVLDLNVNLNSDGLHISAKAAQTSSEEVKNKSDDEDVNWAIPDFSSSKKGNKFKFGKKEEE